VSSAGRAAPASAAHYVDSLPAMIDIGPGSPVGVEFGYGARFPAKFRRRCFICDWTFGTMYAPAPRTERADLQGDERRVSEPHYRSR